MANRLRVVIVEDNGFDPAWVESSGLGGLAARTEALGGSLPVVGLPIPEDDRG